MNTFTQIMNGQKVLPIIQAQTIEQGLLVAEVMQAKGYHVVEVVLRSDISAALVTKIKRTYPEMIVGAGTVVNAQSLDAALSAGADFIITPTTTPALLELLSNVDVPVIPGVSNMSDVLACVECGYSELKLFPAVLSGGVQMLKTISSVFPQLRFCPTGGISQANMDDFLALNNVTAVGGTWLTNITA
jgi:2-dehydro-3-deoxyphosphogluconate aldolase/(4S)-4-hydroxy-2-oxoglutarate aldolase